MINDAIKLKLLKKKGEDYYIVSKYTTPSSLEEDIYNRYADYYSQTDARRDVLNEFEEIARKRAPRISDYMEKK